MKKKYIIWFCLFLVLVSGCSNSLEDEKQETDKTETAEKEYNEENLEMKLIISDTEVPVTWEDNDSVRAIMDMISDRPLTVQMSMYAVLSRSANSDEASSGMTGRSQRIPVTSFCMQGTIS